MSIVLVGVSTNFWIVHSPWSVPWLSVHFCHNLQGSPLLHPGKYWFIYNFLSSSLHQTNNKPLALPCVLCGVSNALATICESLIQINFLKILNAQVDSDGGAYCSDLQLM